MGVDREGPIHRAVLAYLKVRLPGAVIHHSPNSFGDMHNPGIARQVAKAKSLGMLPGFPDLAVFWRGWGLFFEVKSEGNGTQENQRNIGDALAKNGFYWAVVRSINDVDDLLERWGVQP